MTYLDAINAFLDSIISDIKFFHLEEANELQLSKIALGSAIMGLVLAVAAYILIRNWIKKSHSVRQVNLTMPFVVVWFFSFVVYNVGMYTGSPWSIPGNSFMAAIHAFGTFLLASDVSEIHEPFHNSALYMFCFSMAHLLAALVSMFFVIKHFGYNIVSWFRMFHSSHRACETTYVFWGLNNATYYLAKDIKHHHEENNDASYRIVIVRTNDNSGSISARNGMERLFNFLSLNNEEFAKLVELDCLTASTYGDLSHFDDAQATSDSEKDLLGHKLNLKTLRRIIAKATAKQLHMFFLSDDDAYNIQSLVNLLHDKTVDDFANAERQVKLYCHARRNSVHRVVEDEYLSDNIEVKVIDSSLLSIERLKLDLQYQPVSFVSVEPDATVSSAFNSLVVGFSEVGADMVRFLYEFGAFVKSGCTNNQVTRSDFRCHVVDKGMNNLAGAFWANAPGIKSDLALDNIDNEESAAILLHHMDCRSVEFYRNLKQWITDLNYVVICTEDDEINISLAVRILRYAIRYRQHLNRFRIMVRIKNDDDGHIQRVAWHYNRLWVAETNGISDEKGHLIHQNTIKAHESIDTPIKIFGLEKDTYTFSCVISDDLEAKAVEFKTRYDSTICAMNRRDGDAQPKQVTWNEEYRNLKQLIGEYRGFAPTYTAITRLRRIQRQNRANAMHIQTKIALAKAALGEDAFERLIRQGVVRKENETIYTNPDGTPVDAMTARVLDVLAQTEHLRWNAAHEVLGYTTAHDVLHRDEARLIHGCIKDWQELPPEIQRYDYNVVDVSLFINNSSDT